MLQKWLIVKFPDVMSEKNLEPYMISSVLPSSMFEDSIEAIRDLLIRNPASNTRSGSMQY